MLDEAILSVLEGKGSERIASWSGSDEAIPSSYYS